VGAVKRASIFWSQFIGFYKPRRYLSKMRKRKERRRDKPSFSKSISET